MHVVGIRPGDEKWRKMKEVYDSCVAAGVLVPTAVQEFFNHEKPDEVGVVIDLGASYGEKHKCCTEYSTEGSSGFEIDVTQIPADVKKIRFYCSW